MAYAAVYSVESRQAAARARQLLLNGGATLLGALAAGLLIVGRYDLALALVFGAAGAVALVWRPILGLYAVFAAALLFDHNQVAALNLLTGRSRFWDTIGGIPPAGALVVATLGIYLVKRAHAGTRPLVRFGPLFVPMAAFFIILLYGIYRGSTFHDPQLPRGFQPFITLIEIGSLIYLPIVYIVAHTMIDSPRQVKTLAWVAAGTLFLKSLQSMWVIYQLRGGVFHLNEIASHEDALFMNTIFLLAIGLWFYRGPLLQRLLVTATLPVLTIAMVANQRRAGFVTLGIGVAICLVLLVSDKHLRWPVLRFAAVVVLLLAGYTAAFWNATGPLAMPVVLLRSLYEPDKADEADRLSGDWRQLEKLNIRETIQRAPLLGIGFGRQYLFWIEQPSLDPTGFIYWRFVTHNAMYWLWMKVGAIGFAMFWYVLASAIVLGTLALRRDQDPTRKAILLMVIAFVAMQAVFMYADIGLGSGRNMTFLGVWLGALASLSAGGAAWKH